MSDDKDDKRRNPWGRTGNTVRHGPWGSSGQGGGGGPDGPDLDDLLRAARERLGSSGGDGGVPPILVIAAVAILAALWAASGFYKVEEGENAVIQRFGALERVQATSGLGYHAPWPLETARIVDMTSLRNLSIGFGTMRDGRKVSAPAESLVLTADRNIVDVHLTVQWYIRSAEDYLFQIADPDDTLKKVAESALREVAGQTRMEPLMNDLDGARSATRAIIQGNLDAYHAGIAIDEVQIGQLEVHPDAQAAFQDVQSAKQNAESAQNDARAYRNQVIPEAHGAAAQITARAQAYKAEVVALAEGGAARFTDLYQAYTQGQEVTRTRLYIEMMESVLGKADTIILDDEAGRGALPYLSLDKAKPEARGSRR